MFGRILPLLAFIFFAGFFAVILWKVPRLDLAIVIGIGIVLVLFDLRRQFLPAARRFDTR